jgi:ABC-2 type transport system permease protein
LSVSVIAGVAGVTAGFAALAGVWLPPGIAIREKVMRSMLCIAVTGAALALVTQVRTTRDVSEDQRNSFSLADQRQLAMLTEPLAITVHLAPEDPRYVDLRRNVLAKLERAMPLVSIRLGAERRSLASPAGDDAYGEIEYRYG